MIEPAAATKAQLATVSRMYPIGQVPKKPDYPYGTYSATFGRPDAYGLDATHGIRWGRIVVQGFGRTLDSINDLMNQVVDAVLDQVLPLDGWDATPCGSELDPTLPTRDADDDGVLASTATFTFTATRQEA